MTCLNKNSYFSTSAEEYCTHHVRYVSLGQFEFFELEVILEVLHKKSETLQHC